MAQTKQFFEFGPFRIGRGERLLRRGDEVVPLPPKAVDLLLALVERGGDVVGKEQLLTLVWPDTFVEEGSLAQNVSLLRRSLGETEPGQYIATIPRRGYRFVSPVRALGDERTGRGSLAVLPLANLSGDPAQGFFADGMTEELISCLMRIEALRVASRTSVVAYRDTNRPLRQVASELGVEWVVEGAVMQSGRRVRITVRLIDGSSERQVWAETYDRDMSDVLDLQSAVARDVARHIRVHVSASEQAHMTTRRRIDPDAYDAYLRARHFWNKRTREDLRRANGYFRSAIDADPTYAPAYAGLADTYALLCSTGYDVMPPTDAMPPARAAALRALELDDALAQAHASLGYIRLSYEWDWKGAEAQFERAIACNPSYATAHQWYAHCLFSMGRLGEGAAQMRRALELDPLSVACNMGVAWSAHYARRFDDAIAQHLRTLEIVSELPMVLYELGLAYQNRGRHADALAVFERAHRLSGGEAASVMLLAQHYAFTGRQAEAQEYLAALEAMARERYVPPLYMAFVHAAGRNASEAFAWFERAFEERSNYMIYLAVEPTLDPIRADPRYQALLRRVGLDAVSVGTSPGPRGLRRS
jgi:TolB-like protein/Tfp pilus assembly protein PilF